MKSIFSPTVCAIVVAQLFGLGDQPAKSPLPKIEKLYGIAGNAVSKQESDISPVPAAKKKAAAGPVIPKKAVTPQPVRPKSGYRLPYDPNRRVIAYSAKWTWPGGTERSLRNHLAQFPHNLLPEVIAKMTFAELKLWHDGHHDAGSIAGWNRPVRKATAAPQLCPT